MAAFGPNNSAQAMSAACVGVDFAQRLVGGQSAGVAGGEFRSTAKRIRRLSDWRTKPTQIPSTPIGLDPNIRNISRKWDGPAPLHIANGDPEYWECCQCVSALLSGINPEIEIQLFLSHAVHERLPTCRASARRPCRQTRVCLQDASAGFFDQSLLDRR
jgi:hypothetical protein